MFLGVELWLEGASHELFHCLNGLGISTGVDAARSHIDHLRIGFDDEILKWKHDSEVRN